ncbi:MAG TPA: hypothetical protein VNZ53_54980 [Steroidobacteraceae bacterium]|jgi:hypothetical protein|nr:hypothetical protein [Steroidobacteraceae bacterium]
MAYGHGGRREGAGRPQGASNHRNLPFGTLTAALARKFDAEAVNILATIMEDERALLDAIACGEDAREGKPSPKLIAFAVRKLRSLAPLGERSTTTPGMPV